MFMVYFCLIFCQYFYRLINFIIFKDSAFCLTDFLFQLYLFLLYCLPYVCLGFSFFFFPTFSIKYKLWHYQASFQNRLARVRNQIMKEKVAGKILENLALVKLSSDGIKVVLSGMSMAYAPIRIKCLVISLY